MSVFAAYYAEARFSVVVSYMAAAAHNPLVHLWLSRDREGECGGCHHFLLWVYVPCALVMCCAALGAAELLLLGQQQIATRRRGALPMRSRAAALLW